MELKIVIDNEKLKELVEEAKKDILEQLCAECPYREEKEEDDYGYLYYSGTW